MLSAFLTVAVIHLFALMSPGPDFAMVTKQSLTQSRKAGIATAAGLALGMLVHVTYCLLGIGLLISRSILLFTAIKYLGAAYLLWIGLKALFGKHAARANGESLPKQRREISLLKALQTGFLTNVLNPKATLFVLALFTQIIDPATPIAVQIFYGAYMAAMTFLWFTGVASVFSLAIIRRRFEAIQPIIERSMGAVLVALGVKVALSARE